MTKLNQIARDTIKYFWIGVGDYEPQVTIAGYIRHYYGDEGWRGDECGCVDDRCIGYHHDEREECHCLEVWIREMVRDQARDRARDDLAVLRYLDATPVFPAGLQSFTSAELVELRDAFTFAVAEDEAFRDRMRHLDR